MPVHKYKNYEEYRRVQIEGNKRKITFCWAIKADIKKLSTYIQNNVPRARFGICHGTRQGKEQAWFREFLKIDVLGTEISPTAKRFPHTIQWDFHNTKPEWIGNVDFIYSNSFDHTCRPVRCLDAWMSCIQPKGICIIEWCKGDSTISQLDPFGANLEQYKKMITAKYRIRAILQATPTREFGIRGTRLLIVEHK